MFKRNRRPTLPGQILVAHYLEPRALSVSQFARDLGVSRKHLSDIVNGRARVTPSVAVRLARALGTSPALWVNLQAAVDIFDAEQEYVHKSAGGDRAPGRSAA
jgi:addiction module HigA family antidote